jgi:hypothetical protein
VRVEPKPFDDPPSSGNPKHERVLVQQKFKESVLKKQALSSEILFEYYPPENKSVLPRVNSDPSGFIFDDDKLSQKQFLLEDPHPLTVNTLFNGFKKWLKVDYYVQVYANHFPKLGVFHYKCIPNWLLKRCKNGHITRQKLGCGVDWCEDCGAKNSPVHRRRQSKLWARFVKCIKTLYYMVQTYPTQCGDLIYDPVFLTKSRKFFFRLLGEAFGEYSWSSSTRRNKSGKYKFREFFELPGHSTFHFEGEKSDRYLPHWNHLFFHGWIDKLTMYKLRIALTRYLEDEWGVVIPDKMTASGERKPVFVDIHGEYTNSIARKIHIVQYVSRATLLHFSAKKADVYYALSKTCWYGKWETNLADQISPEALPESVAKMSFEEKCREHLAHGRCPLCGEKTFGSFQINDHQNDAGFVEIIPGELWVKTLSLEPEDRGG